MLRPHTDKMVYVINFPENINYFQPGSAEDTNTIFISQLRMQLELNCN